MGVAAVADRIAELLAPGIRARMSQPRFVTLTAVGAVAGQRLVGAESADGSTTPDIAFEWLVVESLVRSKAGQGVPGSQKAQRAVTLGERLNRGDCLRGPRVFGFTGVYRPFSIDARVINAAGLPDEEAEELVETWERGHQAKGFFAAQPGSEGARFRREIADSVQRSLALGHCAAPPTGQLLGRLAAVAGPTAAKAAERRILRRLVDAPEHEVRAELTSILAISTPDPETPEHRIAEQLLAATQGHVRHVLACAIAYEECTTLLNNTFSRLLAHAGAQANGMLLSADAQRIEHLRTAGRDLPPLVRRAVAAAAVVSDTLAQQVSLEARDVRSAAHWTHPL